MCPNCKLIYRLGQKSCILFCLNTTFFIHILLKILTIYTKNYILFLIEGMLESGRDSAQDAFKTCRDLFSPAQSDSYKYCEIDLMKGGRIFVKNSGNVSKSGASTMKFALIVLAYIGCFILAISPFLPYMSANVYGQYYSTDLMHAAGKEGEGVLYLIFAGSIAVCLYFKKYIPALLLSTFPVFLWVFHIVRHFTEVIGSSVSNEFQFEIGCYFILVGALISFVAALILSIKSSS